ncbi:unnamed protein product [Protopolystoma xenopodis]|uniref:Uncharacterized protein n=1 Tax=Protopolystoma xenopodis TaxID=117903 RepID=A0A448WCM2_9PLAT|nr:unnamed protein product [Protopolystoma xenopodis]
MRCLFFVSNSLLSFRLGRQGKSIKARNPTNPRALNPLSLNPPFSLPLAHVALAWSLKLTIFRLSYPSSHNQPLSWPAAQLPRQPDTIASALPLNPSIHQSN